MDDESKAVAEAEMDYAAARADAADRIKNQMMIADATMKALLLANGGAMIALFTFVGNLVAKAATPALPFDTARLWLSFAFFVGGLVAALIVHAFAFLSQDRYYKQAMFEAWRHQRTIVGKTRAEIDPREHASFGQGQIFYVIAFSVAIVSIALFATGCGFALSGVLRW